MRDFRGSGLLGLKHLWNFSLKDNRSQQVFNTATGEKTWYFYAAAGINISGKVIQFIEEVIKILIYIILLKAYIMNFSLDLIICGSKRDMIVLC